MSIPARGTDIRTLPAHAFPMDVEPLSRADAFSGLDQPARNPRAFADGDLYAPIQATIPTLSCPQRIAALISRATAPPLRRIPQAARVPMNDETRAMLLYAHTAHAIFGSPTSAQTHQIYSSVRLTTQEHLEASSSTPPLMTLTMPRGSARPSNVTTESTMRT